LEGLFDGERQWSAFRGQGARVSCTEGICNTLIPLTAYYFANAGDITASGASFSTDANGDGPNDAADWSAANYFNGDYLFWTGFLMGRHPSGGGFQCKTERTAQGAFTVIRQLRIRNGGGLATLLAIGPITSSATWILEI
jgi:hypothetical protein